MSVILTPYSRYLLHALISLELEEWRRIQQYAVNQGWQLPQSSPPPKHGPSLLVEAASASDFIQALQKHLHSHAGSVAVSSQHGSLDERALVERVVNGLEGKIANGFSIFINSSSLPVGAEMDDRSDR